MALLTWHRLLRPQTFLTRPCTTTLTLVGKAYTVAGQAGACLHTTAILQEYQADLLRDLDKGKGVGSDAIKEFHWATDLDS